MTRSARAVLAALAFAGLCAAHAGAQDLEPRAYSNTPVGMNFALLGYAYTNGGIAADASIPLENGEIQTSSAVLAYARSVDVFGMSGKFDVALPYAYLSGSATFDGAPVTRRVDGLGDMRLRFTVNFFGAPALSFEEFASYEQDVLIGASLYVFAPVGQYDNDRLVNLSSHRWSFKPEIGISKNWDPFILELSAAAQFYTNNGDFFPDHRRAQDPIYSAQAHAIYAFRRGFWGSIDLTYYRGGQSSIDGTLRNDLESNARVGGTISIPIDRRNSIKLYGSTTVYSRTGSRFDLIGAFWQVRFGGGI